MNLVCGKISIHGRPPEDELQETPRQLVKLFGDRPGVGVFECGQFRLYAKTDQNVIVGRAEHENNFLAYVGAIHNPLGGWGSGSPMDDADATARFLLEAYLREGVDVFSRIQGQFAIVFFDSQKEQVSLVSDALGMRSWFYAMDNDGLTFGSTLASSALLKDGAVKLDRTNENFMLTYGFLPGNMTLYAGFHFLAPASILKWESGSVAIHTYTPSNPWQHRLKAADKDTSNFETIQNRLYDCFMTAVEEQAASDPSVAVLLGGFDSALVSSALARLGKKVETFSFRYSDRRYNQPLTRELATYLRIKHHWVPIHAEDIGKGLESYAKKYNTPTVWPNYVIQTEKIARVIQSMGIRHCFSGDGCDALFYGYPSTFRRAMIYDMLSKIKFTRKTVSRIVNLIGASSLDRRLGHPFRIILNILRSLGRSNRARNFITFKIFDETSLRMLNGSNPLLCELDNEAMLDQLAAPYENASLVRKAYIGKGFISPNKTKLIGSSDSAGITISSPYLHPGLKAFAVALPDQMLRPEAGKVSMNIGKFALAKMADSKKMLPGKIIYQRKMAAIDAPIDRWFSGPLEKECMEKLKNLPFVPDPRYLESLIKLTKAEELYMDYVAIDKVISYGCALLVTYAAYARFIYDMNEFK